MVAQVGFRELIGGVRAGEEAAAAELVQRFGPVLSQHIRSRLASLRLRRLLDAEDVSQMVLASFFARAARGQFELDTPEQLLRLLFVMARRQLSNQARKYRAARRDQRRVENIHVDEREPAAPAPTPSWQVSAREQLQETLRRLSDEERKLLLLRQQGWEWKAIASEVGGSAEALRKQLVRAVGRVAVELGWSRYDKN